MRVQKTVRRHAKTLEHGEFEVRESVQVCAGGCRHANGKRATRRALSLARSIQPGRVIGYDVMTFVGLQRFVEHRQREEIRAELENRHGVRLSSGEISALARDFIVYLETLHRDRAPSLRAALAQDGGWPMHIDATGEDGRGTLFVVYAGWRGWALGAWKIPTERADAIVPKLRSTAAAFGAPCAVMRDLGRAVIEAAREFVGALECPIPVLGCHLHFLKDIGKDLLRASHDDLRNLFRRFRVRPRLRTLARALGRSLDADIEQARAGVTDWLAGTDERFLLPDANNGLAVVRALAQWVLDYADDGTDAGFPFDRPYLDFYRRCQRACRAVESLLRKPHNNAPAYRALKRLHRLVALVRSELPFQARARILQTRARLFDELRDALRLEVKPSADRPSALADAQRQAAELRDGKQRLEALQASLQQRRPERGPAHDTRKAIDLILRHLERHGPSLWGHLMTIPPESGGGTRLVARTNVLLESFFHAIKHGERRRSGRKVLSQDFEQLPAAAALARNLKLPDYVAILCGDIENLPHAFAQLDAPNCSMSLPARLRADAVAGRVDDTEIVSSSLPRADRTLVRTEAMHARVMAEADSRAPRRSA